MSFNGCKGYTLISKEELPDVNSVAYVLKHECSGARVCLLENDDDNKAFMIGFRTIPKDSTGVAHILEHSVLGGSEKYPVKDAMTEVSKGSLNTYLNALTYPDRTVYPVASLNEKDFNNLMSVYLDSVFKPYVYYEPKTFMQEGWHYELESPEDELTINGVVYNEMKGVYSSPEDTLMSYVFSSLFPDTFYGYESGGDPKCIPDLTYEQFLDFHRTMYHPSNSRIFIYGNTDFEEKLRFIDEEYLSKYEEIKVDSEIPLQMPFSEPVYLKKEFSISDEEDEASSAFLSYNVCVCQFDELKISQAMDVINYALCSVPGAKLKERLTDAGIGTSVYSSFTSNTKQCVFSIIAEGANKDDEERFVSIIEDTIKEIIEEGFDKKPLLAAITSQEFSYKEADFGYYPKGIVYGMFTFDLWNFTDDDFLKALKQSSLFSKMKEWIDEGFFEKVLKERILENTHKSIVTMVPVKGLLEKEEEEQRKKLSDIKESLSKEKIDEIVKTTKALKEYQDRPDSEEALATIPTLTLSDIPKKGRNFDIKRYELCGNPVVYCKNFTNGINYAVLSFSMKNLPKEYIKYISVAKVLMGQIDTKKYSYGDLISEIDILTGGIGIKSQVYRDINDSNRFDVCLEAKFKCLNEKTEDAISLVKEILFNSDFSDRKRIKDILNECRTSIQAYMTQSGHAVALNRMFSYFSAAGEVSDTLSGLSQFRIVEELLSDFDNLFDEYMNGIKEALKYILSKGRLSLGLVADESGKAVFDSKMPEFIDVLPEYKEENIPYDFKKNPKNEGLYFSSQVNFDCVGGNYKEMGLPYVGSLQVAKNILSNDFLWNRVRLQGGAYGVMCSFSRNGESYIVSYRDPNISKTYETYKEASGYIADFKDERNDLERYIISAIGDIDTPYTPSMVLLRIFGMYKIGTDNAFYEKERTEILNTDLNILHGLSKYIDIIVNMNYLCTVGSKEAIYKDKEIFGEIVPLFSSEKTEEEE